MKDKIQLWSDDVMSDPIVLKIYSITKVYFFYFDCEEAGKFNNKGVITRHPFTSQNWKYHKTNYDSHNEALRVIL